MTEYASIDYFTDESILDDPNPYFEYLRAQSPVQPTGHYGVVAVTGYDEATQIYRDNDSFSACNTVAGPFTRFPVPLEGDDVGDLIARHRDQLPQNDLIVTMDPPMHSRERALLMRLMTPNRLKENESFMWRLADEHLDTFLNAGHCEFIGGYAKPFSTLVIADLLGVPREHHQRFLDGFGLSETGAGDLHEHEVEELNTLSWLYEYFAGYVEERRRTPKDDVLSELAHAKYPDGSTPDVMAVVHIATFLFAAGQETTARLLSSALKYLAEFPHLQDELRSRRELIPTFIEECLRMDSPIKTDFRMTKRATTIGGADLAPGTPVVIFNGAANRDPGRFGDPSEFRLNRSNTREHIAFGRGIHSCPGGPLARTEGRISIERILTRTRDIRFSEAHHGSAPDRRFEYEPSWMLRALHELHVEFTPVDA